MGVPFTVSGDIRVKGLRHSLGVPSRRGQVAPSDADAVRALREAGAIPVCATNVSELALWWGDCSNGVYGTTLNPYDSRRNDFFSVFFEK